MKVFPLNLYGQIDRRACRQHGLIKPHHRGQYLPILLIHNICDTYWCTEHTYTTQYVPILVDKIPTHAIYTIDNTDSNV